MYEYLIKKWSVYIEGVVLLKVLKLDDLQRLVLERRRFVMKLAMAMERRGGVRSIEESLRLAKLARSASRLLYEVIRWERKERVLRLRL